MYSLSSNSGCSTVTAPRKSTRLLRRADRVNRSRKEKGDTGYTQRKDIAPKASSDLSGQNLRVPKVGDSRNFVHHVVIFNGSLSQQAASCISCAELDVEICSFTLSCPERSLAAQSKPRHLLNADRERCHRTRCRQKQGLLAYLQRKTTPPKPSPTLRMKFT